MKITRWIAVLFVLVLAMGMAAYASAEPSGEASDDPLAPMEFPDDAKIVSATMYSVYTKSPSSMQDAVIRATLYWDVTNDKLYAVRFLQPMLPFDDNGIAMGWACVTDEAMQKELAAADALVELSSTTEPDAELTARYEQRYQQFKKIYPALKELFPEIR